MVNPKELKLGNKVSYKYKTSDRENSLIYTVSELRRAHAVISWTTDMNKAYDELEPLPLTKERLIEYGFKHITHHKFESYPLHNYWVRDGVCLFYNESDDRDIYLFGFAEMRMGKYYVTASKWRQSFHQLQNFYYENIGLNLTRPEINN